LGAGSASTAGVSLARANLTGANLTGATLAIGCGSPSGLATRHRLGRLKQAGTNSGGAAAD